jgi:magnesium transporter
LREGRGRIRSRPAGYLAYALVDAIVDAYFPILEAIGGELEALEDRLYEGNLWHTASREVHTLRRELARLRRAIWPMREALSTVMRVESETFDPDTRIYVRDCADHVTQLIEVLDTEREICNSLMELYLTSVSNRMNEVMKVLTIIATLFIPLGFIAGLYGMNFDSDSPFNMPELRWRYGYPFALALMGATAAGMLLLFRRLGWLGGRRP